MVVHYKIPYVFGLLLLVILSIGWTAKAALKDSDLQNSYDKYWVTYSAALKRIMAEKENSKAALLVDQMGKDLLPVFGKLLQQTQEWKKSHNGKELKQFQVWVGNNAHADEAGDLQSSLLVRASREGGALGKSVGNYMRSMATVGKNK